jgi:hypothetical protein
VYPIKIKTGIPFGIVSVFAEGKKELGGIA